MKDSTQTAIVLAGGMASRMGGGCDKAFLKVGGEPIIRRQINILKRIFKRIIIVTNAPDRYKYFKDIEAVSDVVRKKGPLGGIYSGLMRSGSFHNFVVACDMPFLNRPFIEYLVGRKGRYDIVIPKVGGRYHPLFGVYSKNCIPVMERFLGDNRLKISGIFPKVKTKFVSKRIIERFDKRLLCLININTKEDCERYTGCAPGKQDFNPSAEIPVALAGG